MKRIYQLTLAAFLASVVSGFAADTRVYEMRTYYANPGKLDDLNSRFRNHTMELFKEHGMENIGYWMPADNVDNKLIYILAYPSRDAREKSWKAFMEDADWNAAYKDSTKDGKLVKKVESKFLKLVDYSPDILVQDMGEERLFELRVYHATEGKMDKLHARFRDHTIDRFAAHGMRNWGYWVPMEDQEGAGDTLIYLLAFSSAEARNAAWEDFRNDPKWKAAYETSTKDGRLVSKVDSTLLVPTDYSPTK